MKTKTPALHASEALVTSTTVGTMNKQTVQHPYRKQGANTGFLFEKKLAALKMAAARIAKRCENGLAGGTQIDITSPRVSNHMPWHPHKKASTKQPYTLQQYGPTYSTHSPFLKCKTCSLQHVN
jgi:hypothetical protein